ncbi:hypothetical protein V6N13_051108 [Hibiscus sabdariffa]|uniref:Uncharacterized protein n=1 Tax=Hibiscus sabdariffa TaxID=183260 RepID=A0ABR2T2K3_9ROSI
MTKQDDLFDVKVDNFSEVGDCSNETVGLINIEIEVDGEAEGESDSDSSFDTIWEECLKFYENHKQKKMLSDDVHEEHIFEDATTTETSNVRENKGKEEKQKIDRDVGGGDGTNYIR